jgi:hypothetical protein
MVCHSGEGRNPETTAQELKSWIPAYAGMTTKASTTTKGSLKTKAVLTTTESPV